jgi:PHD/YefM family antitoxin component YafN of YafNO toxin-antitoxin module
MGDPMGKVTVYKGMTVGVLTDCVLATDYEALRDQLTQERNLRIEAQDYVAELQRQLAEAVAILEQAQEAVKIAKHVAPALVLISRARQIIPAIQYNWHSKAQTFLAEVDKC